MDIPRGVSRLRVLGYAESFLHQNLTELVLRRRRMLLGGAFAAFLVFMMVVTPEWGTLGWTDNRWETAFWWAFFVGVGLLIWSSINTIGSWKWRFGLLGLVITGIVLAIAGVASETPSISVSVFGIDFRPKDLDNKIDDLVSWLVRHLRGFFRDMTFQLNRMLVPLQTRLLELPWWIMTAVIALLAWRVGGGKIAFISVVCLSFLAVFQLWDQAMITMSVVGTATVVSVVLAVPMGIAMAKNKWVEAIMRPVLDLMQTMPPFVYLIPAIYFLGLGKVPAVMATLVYAMPPAMRLTNLGIRLVSPELKEAARAFGTTPWQMLFKVELPLARPTIMAGVNQTIMMALAMVVVASMVGAGGLGADILNGIANLEFGKGLMAGIGIVALAIVIDRISQSMAKDPRQASR